MCRTSNHGWPLNGHCVYYAAIYGVIKMNEKLYRDMQRSMVQICDAFSALEFAYRNANADKDFSDVLAIIGAATHSGMSAFENLSSAIDKVAVK